MIELLGDPDEGLPIRKSVRDRLLRQKQAVAAGERGEWESVKNPKREIKKLSEYARNTPHKSNGNLIQKKGADKRIDSY
ncbi:MAG: hypothetical protein AB1656_17115 [Candidatus Omnitrophota bacterium]